jgi:two-component system sensor histidine kinase ChiS
MTTLFVTSISLLTSMSLLTGSMLLLLFILLVVAVIFSLFYRKQSMISKSSSLVELNQLKTSLNEAQAKNMDLSRSVDALSTKNREIQQMLITKIKEIDSGSREKEIQLAQTQEQLEQSEKVYNSFFADTIHEMRTPLSLVLGSLSQIIQDKNLDTSLSAQILSAYRNALALQDYTQELTSTRHADDVASHQRIARYDIVNVTRQICDLFIDWIAMNKVEFQINTQTPFLWIWVDRRKIEFALRVLLSNALKNTYTYGKVSIDISVVPDNSADHTRSFCQLSFQDDGLNGMETSRLGLKQISEFLRSIGGHFIERNLEEEQGSLFLIQIPLGKAQYLDMPVEFVEPDTDLVKLNELQKDEISELIQVIPKKKETGKKLLVIDDSDQIRWFLQHVFNKEYQILEARNGEEGVQVAFKEVPDVILCDIMMPVKDGLQTCREIKANQITSQIPFILLTAKVESEDVIAGIEAGADDYITKPFDVEVLRSKILSILKRREQMRNYYTSATPSSVDASSVIVGKQKITNAFMDSVVKNIEEHLDDPTYEAKILADSLNMSLPTLYRKIKQYSDCSILELTRTIRLKKAAELICTQQYSVQEVAEKVGFNDTATFRKRFTEQYGVTPSQYPASVLKSGNVKEIPDSDNE